MLGIHGIRRAQAEYYLSDPALELPVSGPGQWAGRAAEGLGLGGDVEPDEFCRMLESRHPGAGVVLGSGRVSVPAFDLTFSAPKSASVLLALGGAETARTVLAAHAEAVAGSLSYLEEHALTATRRSGPARAVLPTSGAVAAVFTHGISRNGDPHVHSHVVLANLVHAADGRWSACDRRGLEAHRVAASAVYQAHLRAGLTSDLGVRWTGVPGHGSEVAGVGPDLLGAFSSRGADIRRHMDERGVHGGRGARTVWAATRPPKAPAATFADLAVLWQQRADDAGGRLELEPGRARTGRALLDEHRFAGVISLSAHGGAHRRDVVAAFGTAAREGTPASALERLVDHWVPPGPVGVAEPLQQRRTVVPANHHLRALGPRPVDPDDHAVWLGATRALDAYRDKWGLARASAPLGEAPNLAALPAQRLADHIRTEREVTAARARLGWHEPAAVERGLGR
jgi:conjugative relaxase-like TrwC/TraI family protein